MRSNLDLPYPWTGRRAVVLAVAFLSMFISACGQSNAGITEQATGSVSKTMNIYILDSSITPIKQDSRMKENWDKIRLAKPSVIEFSITQNDIQSYSWADQLVLLESTASQSLRLKFGIAADVKSLTALEDYTFVVTLGQEPVYSGEFGHPMSARLINAPVIFARGEQGLIGFVLRPYHPGTEPYPKAGPSWNGIKDERIRAALAAAGKLR